MNGKISRCNILIHCTMYIKNTKKIVIYRNAINEFIIVYIIYKFISI